MLSPSPEQQEIIDAIKQGFNVEVNAVAGSGKTTTVLSLADQNANKTIIQLTYNSELKEEVTMKKKKLSNVMYLDNLSIYTYHSLAYKFYTKEAKTDIGIDKIVKENMQPCRSIPNIHLLVLDEVQDMNFLYYQFVLKFVRDMKAFDNNSSNNNNNNSHKNNKNKRQSLFQLLVLGDDFQGLYSFKGADTRYLTMAHKLWSTVSTLPFKLMKLSTSYRVTNQIASFLNNVMLGENRIIAQKDGPKVEYVSHPNPFQNFKIIGARLINMIYTNQIAPQDVFILSASVKKEKSPIKLLENMLVRNNIPCYVPMNDTTSVDNEIIQNKLIFSSIHQSKGRERKVVVVYGFDENYFQFYCRDMKREVCPSTLYVAATRATDLLIVLEIGEPLSFLKYTHQEMVQSNFIDFQGIPQGVTNIICSTYEEEKEPFIHLTVSSMLKFLDPLLLSNIVEIMDSHLFTTDKNSFPLNELKVPSTLSTMYHDKPLTEEVYDINGHAIPALYEEMFSGRNKNTIKTFVEEHLRRNKDTTFFAKKLQGIDFSATTLEDQLKIVNVYIAIRERLNFKVAQIKEYKWLDKALLDSLFLNMNRHIENPSQLEYEQTIVDAASDYDEIDAFINSNLGEDFSKIRFEGRVDAMDDKIIWEFKCTEELDPEHKLQVVLYAWLWGKTCAKSKGTRVFKLMNIRTAEVKTLRSDSGKWMDKIVIDILKSKYSKTAETSDKDFLESVNYVKG